MASGRNGRCGAGADNSQPAIVQCGGFFLHTTPHPAIMITEQSRRLRLHLRSISLGNSHMVTQLWRGSLRSLLGLTVFFLVTEPSDSAERFWIDDDGGFFTSTSNWSVTSGGGGGATVPGQFDDANFDQPGLQPVNFIFGSGNVTNRRLDVRNGDVRFDLNNLTYTFTSGATIAAVAGQSSRFSLVDGTVTGDSNGDDFNIGGSGSGFVTVGAGGTLGSGVSRPDIRMGTSSNLTNTFTASLVVEDSGEVIGQQLLVGSLPLANATVNVIGPVASANFASTVTVASNGTGTVNVTSGGTLSNSSTTTIGSGETGDGRVFVRNPGSTWTMGSSLTVGGQGRGEMTISSAGQVTTVGGVTLGDDDTGSGEVNLANFGSSWDSLNLTIGDAGAGEVNVTSDAQLNTGQVVFGSQSSGTGRATIASGGRLTTPTSIFVGLSGTGHLEVLSGGEVHSGAVLIGDNLTAEGRVLLTGTDSRLIADGLVTVADAGDGELTVADGAEFYANNSLQVAGGSGTGIVNLEGGSIYVAGDYTNEGILNHRDGLLQVAGNFQPTASPAPLTIDGDDNSDLPTLDLVGEGDTTNVTAINIGVDNRGEMRLRQDRSLTINSAINIGVQPGSSGTLVVESRSRLESTDEIVVGGSNPFAPGGTGVLAINAGGTVDANDILVYADGVIDLDGGRLQYEELNFFGGSLSQLVWTSGTVINNSGTLSNIFVFLGTDGALTTGQTLLNTGTTATLNQPATLAGGRLLGTIINNSSIVVNHGELENVTNTGTISLENVNAARITGAVNNSGIIRGSGSIEALLTNNTSGQLQVTVGESLGLAAVNNSGHVSVIGGELDASGLVTNVLDNGLISARDATLRFNGGVNNASGMAFSNGTVDVYGDITQQVGGRITISNGGITNFYDDVTIDPGANDVQATGLGGTVGKVVFFGSYNGGVTGGGQAFIEGDHRPGNSAGEVDFNGDVFYGPFSTLEIEIGGLTQGTEFDFVDVAGEAALTGALEVSLIDGFEPTAGDTFEILNAASGLAGNFFSTQLPTLTGGLNWNVLYGANNVVLEVAAGLSADTEPDGDVDGTDFLTLQRSNPSLIPTWQTEYGSTPSLVSSQSVPEPASFLLLHTMLALYSSRAANRKGDPA